MKGIKEIEAGAGTDVEEYFGYLLTQVQNRRVRAFAPILDELGISAAHWRVMSTLARLGGCLMSELAEFTTADRTTLTRTVDQLVDQELVIRKVVSNDRRAVKVEMTERGEALFRRALAGHREHSAQVMKGFTADSEKALRCALQTVLRNVIEDDELFRQVVTFTR